MRPQEGLVVSFEAKRNIVHGVIAHVSYQRGATKVIVAPLHGHPPKVYQYTFNERQAAAFKPPTMRFTEDEIFAARGKSATTAVKVWERKNARTEASQAALGEPDYAAMGRAGQVRTDKVAPGDEVLINYRNGRRWETVAKLNLATGKVAIERGEAGAEAREQKRADLANVRAIAAIVEKDAPFESDLVERLRRKRGPSEVRWLPATLILDVRKKEAKP